MIHIPRAIAYVHNLPRRFEEWVDSWNMTEVLATCDAISQVGIVLCAALFVGLAAAFITIISLDIH